MSKKTTSEGTQSTAFSFDPSSMAAYRQNINTWLPFAQSLFQNPFGNQMFQQESAIGQDQAGRFGSRNMSNVLQNASAMGYGTNSGMINEMLSNASRGTGRLQADAFRSAVLNANQRAMTGMGVVSGFQPLLTGSSGQSRNVQTESGLGTWLPQVAGMAAGGVMNAFMPGFGGARGSAGATSGAASGVAATGAGMNSVFSGVGNLTGASPGYGYGSSSSTAGPWTNPYMFGGIR